ncbi:FMN-binding glutamate synthase family protein [Taibaiella koreensis]|uniref:FMN-binding glutamate synthase family protein n=1 Tax=Taibaiella koreensis TaxID=1268548 RepID=UPI000E59D7E8|nr:FMN-binding glutamate synthase family protein [Taibaiella koreensis]
MRTLFFRLLVPLFLAATVLAWFYPVWLWLPVVLAILLIIGLANASQGSHTILRNFPVLGYFRYFFEFISPELQQYFIERNTDGRPFSRQQRALAYQRAKNIDATTPFGTQLEVNAADYEGLRHSIYPAPVLKELPRIVVGGPQCSQPYSASLFNVSAMSFGSLSAHAVMAVNKGAQEGGFYQNTGEGGLTDYHLGGGDVVWQIGTGYFGCRTPEGNFDAEKFRQKAALPQVKMIELKISQGAKPGHGGVLPAAKNTEAIARIRGIDPHVDVLSPPGHSAFSDAAGFIAFIGKLRELSGGKPVGFKLCIGKASEFTELCEEMNRTGIYPDFITIDGAEGGTGAAPLEFSDAVGMPLEPALIFVQQTLVRLGIREKLRLICSGKILSAVSLLRALALGADMCNSARGFMFSLGCIQALRCNTNVCPTGVATQDKMLMKGLVVGEKKDRVRHFHHNTLHAAMELLAACGKKSFEEVDMSIFMRGDEFVRLSDQYFPDNLPAPFNAAG